MHKANKASRRPSTSHSWTNSNAAPLTKTPATNACDWGSSSNGMMTANVEGMRKMPQGINTRPMMMISTVSSATCNGVVYDAQSQGVTIAM